MIPVKTNGLNHWLCHWNLKNTFRLIFIFLAICSTRSLGVTSVERTLNSTTFHCRLQVKNIQWNLKCDSENFDSSMKFFLVKFQGIFDPVAPVFYEQLLQSALFNESNIYLCDSIWRFFYITNLSTLNKVCDNYDRYLKNLTLILEESSLSNIEIIQAKHPEFLFHVLSTSTNLQGLIISENSISVMPVLPIHFNNSITTLSLRGNEIEMIPNEFLRKFLNLVSLDLSYNLLNSVHKNLFLSVSNLQNLDLSYNQLENIPVDAFSGLVSLKSVSLKNNKLTVIDKDIFRDNHFLSFIDISYNNLGYFPPTIFHNMSSLKNVSCYNCSLFRFDKDTFLNSPNLMWILLPKNNLKGIHKDTFKDLRALEALDFSENAISYLPEGMFPDHQYLIYANFSKNKISTIKRDTFIGAPHMQYFDFSRNRITTPLTDELVKKYRDVEYLGLHHNRIEVVELGISISVRVRKLDISYNLITKFTVIWKSFALLETLKVNNNFLTSLDLPPCIPNMKQTLTFLFMHNRISKLNINELLADEKIMVNDKSKSCLFNGFERNYVDITNNPLLCDCDMYPVYKYITEKTSMRRKLESFSNAANITCAMPIFLTNHSLVSLSEDMLSCPLPERCPLSCYCGVTGKYGLILVNCSSLAMQEVPQKIPDRTTVLYFNKNMLSSMMSLNTYSWSNLIEVHLDFNMLTNLDDWEIPVSLRYLSVRGNKLRTLSVPIMQFISNLTHFELYFGENDKNCDCDRKTFRNFLLENIEFVKDNDAILCNITNNGTTEISQLTSVIDSVLCQQYFYKSSPNQITLIILLCAFFILLITLLLLYYRYRQLILSFIYFHCHGLSRLLWLEEPGDDAIFDAFVAYSSSDHLLVRELLDELENKPPFYRLCIHERNWLPGRFITENIVNSVESSKRTIVILSNAFVSSPWLNVELRASVSKMSKHSMNRIIVILTDKSVSYDSIDPELKYIVSKRTYLLWGERWFWEKLRYALPRKRIPKKALDTDGHVNENVSEIALILDAC